MKDLDSESWINERAPDISLRELAAPLFRRKRVLITTFLVALTAVVLAGILMPPEFTSHMSILVNRERLDPLVTTESTAQMITTSTPVSEEEINSEAELLKSRDVLEQVVLANGLQKQHGHSFLGLFRPKQDEADRVERAVRSLAKNIKVGTGTKTNLIEVSYSSPNPRLSYGVLNTLGNLYLAKHVAVHRPPGSYQFFVQETQNYHQAMEDSEAHLRSFQGSKALRHPTWSAPIWLCRSQTPSGNCILRKSRLPRISRECSVIDSKCELRPNDRLRCDPPAPQTSCLQTSNLLCWLRKRNGRSWH